MGGPAREAAQTLHSICEEVAFRFGTHKPSFTRHQSYRCAKTCPQQEQETEQEPSVTRHQPYRCAKTCPQHEQETDQ